VKVTLHTFGRTGALAIHEPAYCTTPALCRQFVAEVPDVAPEPVADWPDRVWVEPLSPAVVSVSRAWTVRPPGHEPARHECYIRETVALAAEARVAKMVRAEHAEVERRIEDARRTIASALDKLP
jgi:hypothetical protein